MQPLVNMFRDSFSIPNIYFVELVSGIFFQGNEDTFRLLDYVKKNRMEEKSHLGKCLFRSLAEKKK